MTPDDICRGEYPWEREGGASVAAAADSSSPGTATREQLVTQLRSSSNEVMRLREELALLAVEQARCRSYFEGQLGAIRSAIVATEERLRAIDAREDVPSCSSFASMQPSSLAQWASEADYCRGLLILQREREVQSRNALAATTAAAANLPATPDEYDCGEEDAVL